jgi:hypothetical protein
MAKKHIVNGNGYSNFDIEVSGRLGSIETQLTEGNRRFDNIEKGIVGLSGQLGSIDKKLDEHTDTESETWTKFTASLGEVREKVENPKISKRSLWVAAGGIITALTAIIGVALYLFDVLAKP